MSLKAQKDDLENRIEEEKQKKEEYNNQMEYYSTDEYIEKIAREQLGLVMPCLLYTSMRTGLSRQYPYTGVYFKSC